MGWLSDESGLRLQPVQRVVGVGCRLAVKVFFRMEITRRVIGIDLLRTVERELAGRTAVQAVISNEGLAIQTAYNLLNRGCRPRNASSVMARSERNGWSCGTRCSGLISLNTSSCCSSFPRMPSSYQIALWKQESFSVPARFLRGCCLASLQVIDGNSLSMFSVSSTGECAWVS